MKNNNTRNMESQNICPFELNFNVLLCAFAFNCDLISRLDWELLSMWRQFLWLYSLSGFFLIASHFFLVHSTYTLSHFVKTKADRFISFAENSKWHRPMKILTKFVHWTALFYHSISFTHSIIVSQVHGFELLLNQNQLFISSGTFINRSLSLPSSKHKSADDILWMWNVNATSCFCTFILPFFSLFFSVHSHILFSSATIAHIVSVLAFRMSCNSNRNCCRAFFTSVNLN